jgi:tryptophan synthase alpha chain
VREERLKNSLDLISLVGPNTSEQRMREYAEKASGYVYVVSVMGTTGVRENLSSQVSDILQMAKSCFSPLPVVLGFGVKQPEQLESLVCKPHGVVFGSALIKHLDSGHSSADFMRRWVV